MTNPVDTQLTRWQALTLRPVDKRDLGFALLVFGLVALSIWSGRSAARQLSPSGAREAGELLAQLDLPRSLPDALLVRDDGTASRLWDIAAGERTIVTFYAPWCAPCQQELPRLHAAIKDKPESLVVVVGHDEQSEVVGTRAGSDDRADASREPSRSAGGGAVERPGAARRSGGGAGQRSTALGAR